MFPAPAGINRLVSNHSFANWSVPRASGDKPEDAALINARAACSPRQRG
ncbi:hypothetical protein CIT292_09839 [Citrobacter youngae ATCC 29220]|uniref:Uncharacterized protein n=1 Tax=Citrobacter youngae ATCC 29220 TaxID=500640 RepID=D4BH32_9ENTR|nr:hypothetical protein CIT292_09839 [Citrobacter youngae ATCC 29220]